MLMFRWVASHNSILLARQLIVHVNTRASLLAESGSFISKAARFSPRHITVIKCCKTRCSINRSKFLPVCSDYPLAFLHIWLCRWDFSYIFVYIKVIFVSVSYNSPALKCNDLKNAATLAFYCIEIACFSNVSWFRYCTCTLKTKNVWNTVHCVCLQYVCMCSCRCEYEPVWNI